MNILTSIIGAVALYLSIAAPLMAEPVKVWDKKAKTYITVDSSILGRNLTKCPYCKAPNLLENGTCSECGAPLPRAQKAPRQSSDQIMKGKFNGTNVEYEVKDKLTGTVVEVPSDSHIDKMVKCPHCHVLNDHCNITCKNCGAPIPKLPPVFPPASTKFVDGERPKPTTQPAMGSDKTQFSYSMKEVKGLFNRAKPASIADIPAPALIEAYQVKGEDSSPTAVLTGFSNLLYEGGTSVPSIALGVDTSLNEKYLLATVRMPVSNSKGALTLGDKSMQNFVEIRKSGTMLIACYISSSKKSGVMGMLGKTLELESCYLLGKATPRNYEPQRLLYPPAPEEISTRMDPEHVYISYQSIKTLAAEFAKAPQATAQQMEGYWVGHQVTGPLVCPMQNTYLKLTRGQTSDTLDGIFSGSFTKKAKLTVTAGKAQASGEIHDFRMFGDFLIEQVTKEDQADSYSKDFTFNVYHTKNKAQ